MAEFCLDCWNRINGTNDGKMKYVLSKDLDLCEGCGELKPVIVAERYYYYSYTLKWFILPLKIVFVIITHCRHFATKMPLHFLLFLSLLQKCI